MDDFSASLFGGLLSFGKYPTHTELAIILTEYKHIVNICTPSDTAGWNTNDIYTIPAGSDVTLINYPFEDGTHGQYPHQGWDSFPGFINQLITILYNGASAGKIYIHCKGGHGRSALVAAIIYGRLSPATTQEALAAVREAHQKRRVMDDKWRRLGAPQRAKQKAIVKKYIEL